jgi:hypothetical protein
MDKQKQHSLLSRSLTNNTAAIVIDHTTTTINVDILVHLYNQGIAACAQEQHILSLFLCLGRLTLSRTKPLVCELTN